MLMALHVALAVVHMPHGESAKPVMLMPINLMRAFSLVSPMWLNW